MLCVRRVEHDVGLSCIEKRAVDGREEYTRERLTPRTPTALAQIFVWLENDHNMDCRQPTDNYGVSIRLSRRPTVGLQDLTLSPLSGAGSAERTLAGSVREEQQRAVEGVLR